MSAVRNVTTIAYHKDMGHDTQLHFNENGLQNVHQDMSGFHSGTLDYSASNQRPSMVMELKSEERHQKEQMQESLQIQQVQTEQTQQIIPQQYQFQGPMPLQLKYTFRPGQKPSFPTTGDPDFDGRRLRRTTMRKTVDYNAAIIRELENRLWQRDYRDREHLQPDTLYVPHVLPPPSYPENPFNAVTTRFVKTATNKVRCPVFCLAWTPEGRRLITGTSSGEFTLWNGLTFNFETILQAHDCPVRTMVWSNNELWMLTGDHSGFIKYWQSNMNNVKMYQGHREAVRGVSFSPTDNKFVSCSDDGTVRLWDFITCNEERIFRGHGADVKCVHWHPYKSLVASGSKDNQQPVKLWDPRSGKSIATIHAHKATVMDIKWNQNGNWVATASRDHLIKLYDIRNLNNDMQTFRGHKKETSVVAWHPQHEGLMCSGGSDGSILFWHVGTPKEVAAIDQAHDSIVWALAWHPLGHILCSGSNDHSCKFWTRNHPGDTMRDKYNLNTIPASILGFEEYEDESGTVRIPGMGPEDKVDISKLPENIMSSIPGLDSSIFKDKNKPQKKVPYAKPIPKNFQAQWNEQRSSKDIMAFDEDFVPDSKMLLNKLFENAPGAVSVRNLKIDMMYVYGKMVPVKAGSDLERHILEGRDKVVDFINNGGLSELNDVIPHIDASERERRTRAIQIQKARSRQVLSQVKKPERPPKRSRDIGGGTPVSSKKRRSDMQDSDYRNSGSQYSNRDNRDSYRDYPPAENDRLPSDRDGGNQYQGYDADDYGGGGGGGYDDYNDYDDGESAGGGGGNYGNERRNYSRDSWPDDNFQGRRPAWSKGGHRNDFSESGSGGGGGGGGGGGYRGANQSSHSGGGRNASNDDNFYANESRTSRFDKSSGGTPTRGGRRGSGNFAPRRGGGGGRGRGTGDQDYQGSRYSGGGGGGGGGSSNDNEEGGGYYDRGGNTQDEYYEKNRDDYYDSRYGDGNDNYYDDSYPEDGYGGGPRGGGRFQRGGGGRGGDRGSRRNNFSRGGGGSWRGGGRGGREQGPPPRGGRGRGRGPRRGM